MKRALAICAAIAAVVALVFVGLGRTGMVDTKKPVAVVPSGVVQQTTGGASR
jgi:hypothetical protein